MSAAILSAISMSANRIEIMAASIMWLMSINENNQRKLSTSMA
jgi:hypothetical protein